MRGWLIDVYADDASDSMVYWVRTRRGVERVVDRSFRPRIYAHSTPERMAELEEALPILDAVGAVGRERKRIWLGEEPREVLAITIRKYSKVEDVAHTIDNRGRYRDYTLFDVDMRFSQRYLLEKGVFPMGLMELAPEPRMLDDPYAIDYEQPPLRSAVLDVRSDARRGVPSLDDRLVSAEVAGHAVDGSEEDVIWGIGDVLAKEDPDVVYTDGGDAFAIPFLYRRAKELGMRPPRLGRDDGQAKERRGKSYFSYGRILYKPPTHSLRGRVHIDRASSFMFMESGLNGLTDLSRISGVPIQELSRLSPGSAISAMEVNQAIKDGCAVMWKKNLPEDFKTAQELIVSDRGGFIYEPKVGLHERVLEVDFTSLYPNIMVRFNISPETVMCGCCPDPSRRVPVLGYGICDRQVGLIPRVLKPVVERRTRLKRIVRSGVGDTKAYKERVDILKWLLVTCLDAETPVPHLDGGRYGVRHIGDIVDRVAGGLEGEFPVSGLEAFGIDSDLTPCLKKVTSVFRHPAPDEMVEVVAGDRTTRFTPDHPCYVWTRRGMEVRPAATLRRGDRLPLMLPLYDGMAGDGRFVSGVRVESVRRVGPRCDHVYCLGVEGVPHGFALDGGVLTHNCFGYTGYRNARFGRIECHEAINAYGRELMLQASEIAEAHGYEILHGIVDSLWLKGDGDPERFCEHVSGHTGIPLEPEGTYKWIVFLPDRSHGLGVLNRYYGLFEDGRTKVRGIELRRKDTTGLVRDMQSDLLAHLSRAEDGAGFAELVPSALDIVGEYVEAVRAGTVPLERLLITRRVSQGLSEYRQFNDGVAALTQLGAEGFEVHPGEAVRYVMQDRSSRDPAKRVRAEAFLAPGDGYDEGAYVDLVLRGAEGMLLPFGFDLGRLRVIFHHKGGAGTLRRLF
jgi:DNA polymerase elongation subunit (family B)